MFETNTSDKNITYINQSSFSAEITQNDRAKMIRLVTNHLFKRGSIIVRNWLFETNELNKSEVVCFENAGMFHLKRGIGLVWKKLDETNLSAFDFYLSRIASQGIV